MAFDPQVGDMVYYDHLWFHEYKDGQVDGTKDRACFVVAATKSKDDGTRLIALTGISHSPPRPEDRAVNIPVKVGKDLGLDDKRSWIKTSEVNEINCPKDRIPIGFLAVRGEPENFTHGKLPREMREELVAKVQEHSRNQTLKPVVREDIPLSRSTPLKPTPQVAPKKIKSNRPTLSLPNIPQNTPDDPRPSRGRPRSQKPRGRNDRRDRHRNRERGLDI